MATSFQVVSMPVTKTWTTNASPITVTGLINGVSYTFRVIAVSSLGSVSSASSAPVTPLSFSWVYTNYGNCTVRCGSGGTQMRSLVCTDSKGVVASESSFCDTAAPTTFLSKSCNTQSCKWVSGAWNNNCNAVCFGGMQTRAVDCTDGLGSSAPSNKLPAAFCLTTMPVTMQACNTQKCKYASTAWTACSVTCGGGTQTRSVVCSDGQSGFPNASVCVATVGAAPVSQQLCNTRKCSSSSSSSVLATSEDNPSLDVDGGNASGGGGGGVDFKPGRTGFFIVLGVSLLVVVIVVVVFAVKWHRRHKQQTSLHTKHSVTDVATSFCTTVKLATPIEHGSLSNASSVRSSNNSSPSTIQTPTASPATHQWSASLSNLTFPRQSLEEDSLPSTHNTAGHFAQVDAPMSPLLSV
jgi:hypothetical protein